MPKLVGSLGKVDICAFKLFHHHEQDVVANV